MSWYTQPLSEEAAFYRRIPKVELHRHLEGSLRLTTLLDVARINGITLPLRPDLRSLVQMQVGDSLDFNTFLSKFRYLGLFSRTPEIIERITAETIEDAASDHVVYMELRFTPVALSQQGVGLAEVMDWVLDAARKASHKVGIQVRLIASINRQEPVRQAESVARLAAERIQQGLVGLDLAGDEAGFSSEPFGGVFREAAQSGLKITAHAGEWAGAQSVRAALEGLNAERIGHGLRVLEDPAVVALARERGTVFEVCPTSNFQSGVVSTIEAHPLPQMMAAGLNVVLGTDDPSISQITLGNEYGVAVRKLGLNYVSLGERVLAAANAAFLPDAERRRLVTHLESTLAPVLNSRS